MTTDANAMPREGAPSPENIAAFPGPGPVAVPVQDAKPPEPPEPPEPPDIATMVKMHETARELNRVTLHTNFQQAIQDAVLAGSKGQSQLRTLTEAFHTWQRAEHYGDRCCAPQPATVAAAS